jgi:DNA-binding PucR family transcriptional regulator
VVRALKQHLESSVASLTLSVGISEERSQVEEMPTAFSHARQALQRALAGGEQRGLVVLYSELGAEQEVLDALPSDLLDMLRSRVIGRLSDADPDNAERLLEVLTSYMDHNCSAAETASALFIHRNTLRRRLTRIEDVLGVDFTALRDVVEVRLGLRADEVIRSRE